MKIQIINNQQPQKLDLTRACQMQLIFYALYLRFVGKRERYTIM